MIHIPVPNIYLILSLRYWKVLLAVFLCIFFFLGTIFWIIKTNKTKSRIHRIAQEQEGVLKKLYKNDTNTLLEKKGRDFIVAAVQFRKKRFPEKQESRKGFAKHFSSEREEQEALLKVFYKNMPLDPLEENTIKTKINQPVKQHI